MVGDAPPDHGDELGVLATRVAHHDSLGIIALVVGHGGGQHVEGVADGGNVVAADFTVLDGGSQVRQFRRPHGAGQRMGRTNAGGDAQPAADLAGRDPQPLPQQFAHHGAGGQGGIVGPVDRFDDLAEEPVHQAPV